MSNKIEQVARRQIDQDQANQLLFRSYATNGAWSSQIDYENRGMLAAVTDRCLSTHLPRSSNNTRVIAVNADSSGTTAGKASVIKKATRSQNPIVPVRSLALVLDR
ncbi:MAG: hypothetical protein WA996_20930 [Candidatus Promineifilaceae bacterium]